MEFAGGGQINLSTITFKHGNFKSECWWTTANVNVAEICIALSL